MSLDKENKTPFRDTSITQGYINYLDNLHLEVEKNDYSALEVEAELINIHRLYADVLGFSINEVRKHYFERSAPKVDTIRAYTLKDILNYKNSELTGDIVPRIITTGVNILSAYAKTGKSRFMYFLLHSLIISKEFLGFPTRRVGTILFYQLEESTKLIQKRLRNSDFDNEDNEDIKLALETDQIMIIRTLKIYDGLRTLEKDIKQYGKKNKVSLIIIDTLRGAMRGSGISENSAEWASPIGDLQAFSIANDLSIILIHHHNKSKKAAGTSALEGEANQLIDVYKNVDDKGKAIDPKYPPNALIFKTNPRDGLAATFIVRGKRDGSKERLELLDEEGITVNILSLEVKVVNLLKQDEFRESVCKGLTLEEIADKLEEDDLDILGITLERLQESAFVDSNRTKGIDFYYIPDYILDLYGDLGILGKSERLEIKHQDISVLLQTATTKEEVSEAFSGLSEVDKDTVWGLLSNNHKNRIKSILLQTAFSKKEILKIFKKAVSDEDREAIITLLPEEHQIRIRETLAS